MVAMQHALGSVSGNVSGYVNGDITSWEKHHQCISTDYEWLRKMCFPSQSDTIKEKSTSCDMQKNRKTNIIKQLNGRKNTMFFLYQIKAGWDMGFVTLPGSSSAANSI